MLRIVQRLAPIFALFALVLLAPVCRGQDVSLMTLTELQTQTKSMLENKEFVPARPYLMELIKRFEGEGEQFKKNLEPVYYYLAIGYLVEYSQSPSDESLKQAIAWFDRLEKEFPGSNFAVNASLFKADAYRGLQQFDKAADVYEKMLRPPLELEMNNQQRLEVLEKLTQALYIKQMWKRGLPYFEMFLEESPVPDNQALAAAALLEGNIKLGNYDAALKYLRFLVGESPARYKLQLNLALVDAGDRLAKDKRYTEAMLMYRMVLSVPEILSWQEVYLKDLQKQLDLLRLTVHDKSNERAIELETSIFNSKAQIEALKKIPDYTPDLQVRIARNYLLTNRDWESFYAYTQLIAEYPKHTGMQDFLYAAFTGAMKIGLDDEVMRLGETYLRRNDYTTYRDDIIIKLLEYYNNEGRDLDFFDLAQQFVDKNPQSEYAGTVIFLMGQRYLKEERFGEMVSQFKDWDKSYPSVPMSPALAYWIGLGTTFSGDYTRAWEYFNRVLTDYPGSVYAQDALYRRGICYMGDEDYEAARQDFSSFIRKYPDTPLRGEAEYFLGEIDSALGNVEGAMRHYMAVEKYTDNISFIQRAYFQMGSLLEVNRRYPEMVDIYEQFIRKFPDRGELTGAIFQLGRAHEMNGEPQLMIKEYLAAVGQYGDEPYTYGLDDILKVYPERYEANAEYIQQNLELLNKLNRDKAFREEIAKHRDVLFAYLAEYPRIKESIKRTLYDQPFRDELVNDTAAIQPWIKEFKKLQAEFPTEEPKDALARLYRQARQDKRETLAIRLQCALDDLGVNVDPTRVYTEQDFSYASPVSLVWIGHRIEEYDPALAREAYEQVLHDHPESDRVFDAYMALGDLEAKQGNDEQALQFYREAETRFPTDPRMSRLYLKEGDAFLRLSRQADAREKYQQVINNREWRGELHAEALYKTAGSFADQGEANQALAFYKRVYIGYPAFTDWASQAYLESGRILQAQGKTDEARATYDEFLNEELYRNTEVYPQIKQARSAL